jgi:signal transduction histidine kinase
MIGPDPYHGCVRGPADLPRWIVQPGRSIAARRWQLFDVALVAGLLIASVKFIPPETNRWWLALAAPLVVALPMRRDWPVLAFGVAAIGAVVRHFDPHAVLDPLDLVVPLTLYTVASTGASRRRTAIVLATAILGTFAFSLYVVARDWGTPADQSIPYKKPGDPDAAIYGKPPAAPEPPPTVGSVLGQAFGRDLGAILVLGLAAAVGDGVRSRRAHLRSLEQRAADLEREQQQRIALATAAERARITRELHDVVAHGLSVIVVQAQGAAAALERRPDRAAEALRNVITTGRDSLVEMRRLLDVVRRDPADDPGLSPRPGVGSLTELVERVRAAGTPVGFTVAGSPVPLPAVLDLSAYRIAQEALTNTIKHAGDQARASLRVDYRADSLVIEVSDDGVGGPVPPGGDGAGLRGIAERVAMLGGDLAYGPDAAGGFRVRARLPLIQAGTPA